MHTNDDAVATTAVDETPVTGTLSTDPVVPGGVSEDKPSGDQGQTIDLQGEVDRWKHFSRENEQRAKDNYAKLQQKQTELDTANNELSHLRMQNARLNARLKYPSVTDEMFDKLCNETDPDKIDSWAESLVSLTHVGEPAAQAETNTVEPVPADSEQVEEDGGGKSPNVPQSMKKMLKGINDPGTFDPSSSPKSVYDRMLKKQQDNGKHQTSNK